MIYLLHFARNFRHARHYLGYTANLKKRLKEHRAGQGSRLVAVVVAAGIEFECVRTWDGDRQTESKLKRRKSNPRLCPVCHPGKPSTGKPGAAPAQLKKR